MRNLLMSLGLIFSLDAMSSEVVKIISKTNDTITSGDVVFARIEGVSPNNYQKLIDEIPSEIIILMDTDDQSNVKIVVGSKFNPQEILTLFVNNQVYNIEFEGFNWSVIQNSSNKEFSYLVSPEKKKNQSILMDPSFYIGVSLVLVLIYVISLMLKRINRKKNIRKKYMSWIRRIESAETIDSMSLIWRDRRELKEVFENKEKDITIFFSILNKYQFSKNKPTHALGELSKAKNELILKLRGDSHGV